MSDYRIAVFGSGNGSNFQAIADQVQAGQLDVKIELLVCDQPQAKIIERAEKAGVETLVLTLKQFESKAAYEEAILERLTEKQVDLIVLAGYMKLISPVLLNAYKGRIINIHPSLLPSFPGKQGVADAFEYGVKVTGCTVHFVDEGMDTGPIIAQQAVPVLDHDTVESLHQRIHEAEQQIYPEVVRSLAQGLIKLNGRKVSKRNGFIER
ncbi:phosphoribosylglycinamide formyltransferase [Marinicrinis lubricantis]|uniref:Phosphoribosylglycinamide formyltransferase n=1 Tax=Marinicrinis lubricantis TaxID=2086470 RepID=A0ABW1IV64_9BACL